jgi:hypothetical protein
VGSYVVIYPHENAGRGRLATARSSTSFIGRKLFGDVRLRSPSGEENDWVAPLYLFFKIYIVETKWDATIGRYRKRTLNTDLAFVRWYQELPNSDSTQSPQFQWAVTPRRRGAKAPPRPWVTVEDNSSIMSLEQMVPKNTTVHGKFTVYRYVWFK